MDKFTLEDLLIKIMPGGILVYVLYFLYAPQTVSNTKLGMSFWYTFIFFTFAYVAGELIQTIAQLVERYMIGIFFKFYRPSEIFLYEGNPVIKEASIRQKILNHLKLKAYDLEEFKQKYKDLPFYCFKKNQTSQSQSIFWDLYSDLSGNSEIKVFNRGYLFCRGLLCLFLILAFLFFIEGYNTCLKLSLLLFFIFLYRVQGAASTLVFKTVILNLRSEK